jgi:hypothetical protein
MPHIRSEPGREKPLLDIASYARRGPGKARALLPSEIETIARTVRRTPEVMVKVLSHGGQDLGAVTRHFDYLNRKGELDIETDDGQHLTGKNSGKSLAEDWDLDLEVHRRSAKLEARSKRQPPKLTHKIVFSMPAGTPPEKLLGAVRLFCREEFGLQHRYAMVLHTDEPHPHVHVVVKAMSEEGERLNIRKATLRDWRSAFARYLREQGVAANATERAVRGGTGLRKTDAIYRAARRGESTHMRNRVDRVAGQLAKGRLEVEIGKNTLMRTRAEVGEGWRAVSEILERQGNAELAKEIRDFGNRLPPVRTEIEYLKERLMQRISRPKIEKSSLVR